MPQNQTKLAAKSGPEAGSYESTAIAARNAGEQWEIADLAFEFWLARGFQGGSPEEDLFRAERELRARTARAERTAARLFLVPKPAS
jgi:hypothetical protein